MSSNKTSKFLHRIIAAFVLVAFLITDLFSAYAFPVGSPVVARPNSIVLPESIAEVRWHHRSEKNKPTIYIIQDLHANLEAQKNQIQILDHLKESQGLDLIGLEGAWGEVDYQFFRSFPRGPHVRKQMAYELLNKGQINAVDYYSIASRQFTDVIGIDNEKFYNQHLTQFRSLLNQREPAGELFVNLERILDYVLQQNLPSWLASFYRDVYYFHSQELELLDYIHSTRTALKQLYLSEKKFPLLSSLSRLDLQQGDTSVEMLQRQLKQLSKLLNKSENFQAVSQWIEEQLNQDAKLNIDFLKQAIQFIPVNHKADFQPLIGHVQILTKLELISSERLFGELNVAEETIREKIRLNKLWKMTDQFVLRLELMRKVIFQKLTREDYDKNQKIIKSLKIRDLKKYVGPLNYNWNGLSDFSGLLSEGLQFYELAVKREGPMVKILNNAIKQKQVENIGFMIGGFHTKAVRDYYKAKDYNVLVITPRIVETLDSSRYHSLIQEKIFSQENAASESFLAVRDNFVPGPSRDEMLKQWSLNSLRFTSRPSVVLRQLIHSSQSQTDYSQAFRGILDHLNVVPRELVNANSLGMKGLGLEHLDEEAIQVILGDRTKVKLLPVTGETADWLNHWLAPLTWHAVRSVLASQVRGAEWLLKNKIEEYLDKRTVSSTLEDMTSQIQTLAQTVDQLGEGPLKASISETISRLKIEVEGEQSKTESLKTIQEMVDSDERLELFFNSPIKAIELALEKLRELSDKKKIYLFDFNDSFEVEGTQLIFKSEESGLIAYFHPEEESIYIHNELAHKLNEKDQAEYTRYVFALLASLGGLLIADTFGFPSEVGKIIATELEKVALEELAEKELTHTSLDGEIQEYIQAKLLELQTETGQVPGGVIRFIEIIPEDIEEPEVVEIPEDVEEPEVIEVPEDIEEPEPVEVPEDERESEEALEKKVPVIQHFAPVIMVLNTDELSEEKKVLSKSYFETLQAYQAMLTLRSHIVDSGRDGWIEADSIPSYEECGHLIEPKPLSKSRFRSLMTRFNDRFKEIHHLQPGAHGRVSKKLTEKDMEVAKVVKSHVLVVTQDDLRIQIHPTNGDQFEIDEIILGILSRALAILKRHKLLRNQGAKDTVSALNEMSIPESWMKKTADINIGKDDLFLEETSTQDSNIIYRINAEGSLMVSPMSKEHLTSFLQKFNEKVEGEVGKIKTEEDVFPQMNMADYILLDQLLHVIEFVVVHPKDLLKTEKIEKDFTKELGERYFNSAILFGVYRTLIENNSGFLPTKEELVKASRLNRGQFDVFLDRIQTERTEKGLVSLEFSKTKKLREKNNYQFVPILEVEEYAQHVINAFKDPEEFEHFESMENWKEVMAWFAQEEQLELDTEQIVFLTVNLLFKKVNKNEFILLKSFDEDRISSDDDWIASSALKAADFYEAKSNLEALGFTFEYLKPYFSGDEAAVEWLVEELNQESFQGFNSRSLWLEKSLEVGGIKHQKDKKRIERILKEWKFDVKHFSVLVFMRNQGLKTTEEKVSRNLKLNIDKIRAIYENLSSIPYLDLPKLTTRNNEIGLLIKEILISDRDVLSSEGSFDKFLEILLDWVHLFTEEEKTTMDELLEIIGDKKDDLEIEFQEQYKKFKAEADKKAEEIKKAPKNEEEAFQFLYEAVKTILEEGSFEVYSELFDFPQFALHDFKKYFDKPLLSEINMPPEQANVNELRTTTNMEAYLNSRALARMADIRPTTRNLVMRQKIAIAHIVLSQKRLLSVLYLVANQAQYAYIYDAIIFAIDERARRDAAPAPVNRIRRDGSILDEIFDNPDDVANRIRGKGVFTMSDVQSRTEGHFASQKGAGLYKSYRRLTAGDKEEELIAYILRYRDNFPDHFFGQAQELLEKVQAQEVLRRRRRARGNSLGDKDKTTEIKASSLGIKVDSLREEFVDVFSEIRPVDFQKLSEPGQEYVDEAIMLVRQNEETPLDEWKAIGYIYIDEDGIIYILESFVEKLPFQGEFHRIEVLDYLFELLENGNKNFREDELIKGAIELVTSKLEKEKKAKEQTKTVRSSRFSGSPVETNEISEADRAEAERLFSKAVEELETDLERRLQELNRELELSKAKLVLYRLPNPKVIEGVRRRIVRFKEEGDLNEAVLLVINRKIQELKLKRKNKTLPLFGQGVIQEDYVEEVIVLGQKILFGFLAIVFAVRLQLVRLGLEDEFKDDFKSIEDKVRKLRNGGISKVLIQELKKEIDNLFQKTELARKESLNQKLVYTPIDQSQHVGTWGVYLKDYEHADLSGAARIGGIINAIDSNFQLRASSVQAFHFEKKELDFYFTLLEASLEAAEKLEGGNSKYFYFMMAVLVHYFNTEEMLKTLEAMYKEEGGRVTFWEARDIRVPPYDLVVEIINEQRLYSEEKWKKTLKLVHENLLVGDDRNTEASFESFIELRVKELWPILRSVVSGFDSHLQRSLVGGFFLERKGALKTNFKYKMKDSGFDHAGMYPFYTNERQLKVERMLNKGQPFEASSLGVKVEGEISKFIDTFEGVREVEYEKLSDLGRRYVDGNVMVIRENENVNFKDWAEIGYVYVDESGIVYILESFVANLPFGGDYPRMDVLEHLFGLLEEKRENFREDELIKGAVDLVAMRIEEGEDQKRMAEERAKRGRLPEPAHHTTNEIINTEAVGVEEREEKERLFAESVQQVEDRLEAKIKALKLELESLKGNLLVYSMPRSDLIRRIRSSIGKYKRDGLFDAKIIYSINRRIDSLTLKRKNETGFLFKQADIDETELEAASDIAKRMILGLQVIVFSVRYKLAKFGVGNELEDDFKLVEVNVRKLLNGDISSDNVQSLKIKVLSIFKKIESIYRADPKQDVIPMHNSELDNFMARWGLRKKGADDDGSYRTLFVPSNGPFRDVFAKYSVFYLERKELDFYFTVIEAAQEAAEKLEGGNSDYFYFLIYTFIASFPNKRLRESLDGYYRKSSGARAFWASVVDHSSKHDVVQKILAKNLRYDPKGLETFVMIGHGFLFKNSKSAEEILGGSFFQIRAKELRPMVQAVQRVYKYHLMRFLHGFLSMEKALYDDSFEANIFDKAVSYVYMNDSVRLEVEKTLNNGRPFQASSLGAPSMDFGGIITEGKFLLESDGLIEDLVEQLSRDEKAVIILTVENPLEKVRLKQKIKQSVGFKTVERVDLLNRMAIVKRPKKGLSQQQLVPLLAQNNLSFETVLGKPYERLTSFVQAHSAAASEKEASELLKSKIKVFFSDAVMPGTDQHYWESVMAPDVSLSEDGDLALSLAMRVALKFGVAGEWDAMAWETKDLLERNALKGHYYFTESFHAFVTGLYEEMMNQEATRIAA